jgi:hypothetical protein
MVFWGLSVGASHYSERYYIQSGDQALVLRTSLQGAQTDGWWRHLNEESEKELSLGLDSRVTLKTVERRFANHKTLYEGPSGSGEGRTN